MKLGGAVFATWYDVLHDEHGDRVKGVSRGGPDEREMLTSYAEILDILEALPTLVREKRRRLGMSLRDAGASSGVAFNVIRRLEVDPEVNPSWESGIALIRWIGTPDQGREHKPAWGCWCGAVLDEKPIHDSTCPEAKP